MNQEVKLLDVVALLKSIPEQSLKIGQVGTVVEVLDEHHFEVEFVDKKGRTLVSITLEDTDFLVLNYELEAA